MHDAECGYSIGITSEQHGILEISGSIIGIIGIIGVIGIMGIIGRESSYYLCFYMPMHSLRKRERGAGKGARSIMTAVQTGMKTPVANIRIATI